VYWSRSFIVVISTQQAFPLPVSRPSKIERRYHIAQSTLFGVETESRFDIPHAANNALTYTRLLASRRYPFNFTQDDASVYASHINDVKTSSVFSDELADDDDMMSATAKQLLLSVWSGYNHVISFLELGAKTGLEVSTKQVFGGIIDPIINLACPVATKYIIGLSIKPVDKVISDLLSKSLLKILAAPALKQLQPFLLERVLIGVEEKYAYVISQHIDSLLLNSLPTDIESVVTRETCRGLVTSLVPRITHALTTQLVGTLLKTLIQPTMRTMVKTLVPSLTHTLAPIITQSLMHSPRNDLLCYNCLNHPEAMSAKLCQKCNMKDDYYINFYSSYWADIFSRYYVHYYADSPRFQFWTV